MSTKTHAQKIESYFGSDLTNGMTWVDGYGHHYMITDLVPARNSTIRGGFLSQTVDYIRSAMRLIPAEGDRPAIAVMIDNTDEFDILITKQ